MSAPYMSLAPSPSFSTEPPAPCSQTPPDDKLDSIIALVIVGVVALFLLHLLGALRRRSSHKLLHSVVFISYTLSYMLVSYTLGRMQKSSYYTHEFPVWAVCLLMLLGGTDNLMTCNLNDVDHWKSFHAKHLFKGGLVVYIMVVYGAPHEDDQPDYRGPLWAILFVHMLQSYVRIKSMRMASKSHLLSKNVKPIADYMEHEEQLQLASGESPDPASMRGYWYVVTGEYMLEKYVKQIMDGSRGREVASVKFTTVEQIWECKGRLLSSERGLRLKDVCLSMALSKMLNRRFAGVQLAEADLPKTKDFVFRGLLAQDSRYERAFRVIEVELGFVYDLYYTRYPYLYHKGHYLAPFLPVAMVILCSWLNYVLFEKQDGDTYLMTTLFLMVVVTFLEAFQLSLHMTSGWFKVALIGSYVTSPLLQRSGRFPHMIMGLVLRMEALRPWAHRLGQYSLLQNYDRAHRTSNCLHYVTLFLINKAKKGLKRGRHVKLSRQVKQAVVNSLVASNGHLTNGVWRLRENGVHEQLSWACNPSWKVTRTILVWHVATAICKHQLDLSEDHTVVIISASSVATSLSQYCAYLVAFAPDLLPDHSFDSASILDKSIEEACESSLQAAKTMEEKCQMLKSITISDDDPRLIFQGARLARQLTMYTQDMAAQWKVLSDFWAEMMLYVAPCDDTKTRAHLEALARGGEFITHLWALLTHAGVLQRHSVGPAANV